MDPWIEELKVQLEDHNDLVVIMEDAGKLEITDVSYDHDRDLVVLQVAPRE
jgi:hypothetical protein